MNVFVKINLIILALFASITCTAVRAAEALPWYQVEVVVFEQLRTTGILQETWPDDPGYPKVDDASLLIPPAALGTVRPFLSSLFPDPAKTGGSALSASSSVRSEFDSSALDSALNDALARGSATSNVSGRADTPFVQLDTREFQLASAAQRLNNSGRYRVLVHTAWRQPIQKGAEPVLIRLYSGKEDWRVYLETLRQQRQRLQSLRSSAPAVAGTGQNSQRTSLSQVAFSSSEGALGPPPLRAPLDGTLGVRLSRYLHLEVDMVLQKQIVLPRAESAPAGKDDLIVITEDGGRALTHINSTEPALTNPDLHRFRITESRRMRSKEIHFYDHPALGILATIIPFDPKKNSTAPTADALDLDAATTPAPEPDDRVNPKQ